MTDIGGDSSDEVEIDETKSTKESNGADHSIDLGDDSSDDNNNNEMDAQESALDDSVNTNSKGGEGSTATGDGEEPILDVRALFAKQDEATKREGEGIIAGEFELDLGNLLAFDKQEQPKNLSPRSQAQRCVQELFNHVFELPATQSEVGPLADLPPPSTPIPREKSLPKEKPLTKWEKYAKDKGIKKQKKSRMVWDETAREYRPRWGAGRANNTLEEIVKEDKAEEMQAYGAEDPWILEKMKKKERVEKQKKRELVNRKRAVKDQSKDMPATLDITTNTPRRQKSSIERAVVLAQKSTASMGKFDKLMSDEPKIMSKPKHAPLDTAEEQKQNLKIVERVLKRTAAEALDVDRAATLHIRDEQQKASREGRGRKFDSRKKRRRK